MYSFIFTLVDSNSSIRKKQSSEENIYNVRTSDIFGSCQRLIKSENENKHIYGKEWQDKKVYVPINALFKYLKDKTLQ